MESHRKSPPNFSKIMNKTIIFQTASFFLSIENNQIVCCRIVWSNNETLIQRSALFWCGFNFKQPSYEIYVWINVRKEISSLSLVFFEKIMLVDKTPQLYANNIALALCMFIQIHWKRPRLGRRLLFNFSLPILFIYNIHNIFQSQIPYSDTFMKMTSTPI